MNHLFILEFHKSSRHVINKNTGFLNNPINKFNYVYVYKCILKVYILNIIFILSISSPIREYILLLHPLNIYQKLSCTCICSQNNDYIVNSKEERFFVNQTCDHNLLKLVIHDFPLSLQQTTWIFQFREPKAFLVNKHTMVKPALSTDSYQQWEESNLFNRHHGLGPLPSALQIMQEFTP